MSGARLLDDLARALVEPVPRRRALRLLGSAAAAMVLPVGRAGVALAADGTGTCQNVKGEIWTCPVRKYLLCGANPGECIDECKGPGTQPCGSGAGFDCCIDAFRRDGYVVCGKNATCVPTCKAIEDTVPASQKPLKPCGEQCCFPYETCKQGKCVRPCPPKREPCGSLCCKVGQTCKQGKCCPSGQGCGDRCCPSGQKCAFSGSQRVCCPDGRIVSREISGRETRFCCPAGTRRIAPYEACCPPGDPECCEDEVLQYTPVPGSSGEDDLTPLSPYVGRQFCVRGRRRRL